MSFLTRRSGKVTHTKNQKKQQQQKKETAFLEMARDIRDNHLEKKKEKQKQLDLDAGEPVTPPLGHCGLR